VIDILLVIILLTIICLSFIFGFITQNFCLWVDGENKHRQPRGSILLPNALKNLYWKLRIYTFSIMREKEQIYMQEMKKVLNPGLLERDFLLALMSENNPKNIRHIIEVVFSKMEKNRRKKLLNTRYKFVHFFFVTNLEIKYGYAKGHNLVRYTELFVLYNRYLQGEYMPPKDVELAASLFGTESEKESASAEAKRIQKNEQRKMETLIRKKLAN